MKTIQFFLRLGLVFCTSILLSSAAFAQGKEGTAGAKRSSSSNTQGSGRGQSPPQSIEEVFENLDRTQIPTGLLYDRVLLPFSDLAERDGETQIDPTSLQNWRQMYFELQRSSFDTSAMTSLEEIDQRARGYISEGIYPIAIFNFKYNKIKEDAIDRGLLTLSNGRLYDVLNKRESPYEERTAVAATVLKNVTYRGGNVKFMLDESFYFSNENERVEYYEIDFDDGLGKRRMNVNETVIISYSTTGEKCFEITIYNNGRPLLVDFCVDVEDLDPSQHPVQVIPIRADISYRNRYGTGDAYIYRSEANPVLRKPIIIVEGFDAGNDRSWAYYYDRMQPFFDGMRALGYDIVFFNFRQGGTWIGENARLLVKLIQEINAMKEGGHQSVIIGVSTGGLIARYALAYMETKGLDHETRTFISLDSPQNGANIPLGLQYFISFFAKHNETANQNKKQLESAAAQQMLLYHFSDITWQRIGFTMYPIFNLGNNPKKLILEQELSLIGEYPSKLRKVAFANGSAYGQGYGQGFSPGDKLIKYGDWDFGVGPGDGWPGPKNAKSDVWALPDKSDGRTTIFDGEAKWLGLLGSSQHVWVEGTIPYDNAPGGFRDSMKQAQEADGHINALHNSHCFVPTISALDIDTTDPFYNIAGDPDILSKTPFDVIYYPEWDPDDPDKPINEEHVHISKLTARRLVNEIIPLNLVLKNEFITSGRFLEYEARDSIQVGPSYKIYNGATVNLTAGNVVILKPGFKAHSGSSFHASINPVLSSILGSMAMAMAPSSNPAGNASDHAFPVSTADVEQPLLNKVNNSLNSSLPNEYSLAQNYPNPFNPSTSIKYDLKESVVVNLTIYNMLGQVVRTLVNAQQFAGFKEAVWNGRNDFGETVSTGVYIYRIHAGDFTRTRKMMFLK